VTLFELTDAERSGWQRRAARELAAILDAHRDLPVIAWIVGPAGSVLTGQINGLAPAVQVRGTFDAWRAALRLGERRETVCGGGGVVYLRAVAYRNQVHVAVTATVFDDEGGE
jgi:hypothetical protein